MASTSSHLNESTYYPPEDHYVCEHRPLFTEHHGIRHSNFIPPSAGALGANIHPGRKVALKEGRRRVVGEEMVTKPQGPIRKILTIRDYRYNDQFDVSAYQIVVGEKAHCAPFPAQRTARYVRIAENTFPLDDLTLIESR